MATAPVVKFTMQTRGVAARNLTVPPDVAFPATAKAVNAMVWLAFVIVKAAVPLRIPGISGCCDVN